MRYASTWQVSGPYTGKGSDPDEFGEAFRTWVDAIAETPMGRHYSIAWKTIPRSFDAASDRAAIG